MAASVMYLDGRFVSPRREDDPTFAGALAAGEAVWERWPVRAGEVVDADAQCARLERELAALGFAPPMGWDTFLEAIAETAQRNDVVDGAVSLTLRRADAPNALSVSLQASSL